MPSSPITVTLNSNHSKKFVFRVLPAPDKSIKEAILHEARNKFRMKNLSLVYLKGGVIFDQEILPALASTVWVSKGEPYAGPPAGPALSLTPGEVHVLE